MLRLLDFFHLSLCSKKYCPIIVLNNKLINILSTSSSQMLLKSLFSVYSTDVFKAQVDIYDGAFSGTNPVFLIRGRDLIQKFSRQILETIQKSVAFCSIKKFLIFRDFMFHHLVLIIIGTSVYVNHFIKISFLQKNFYLLNTFLGGFVLKLKLNKFFLYFRFDIFSKLIHNLGLNCWNKIENLFFSQKSLSPPK